MAEEIVIKFQISTLQFRLATLAACKALAQFGKVFEDKDKFYAIYPGQWPDEFVVLNRFMRTGLRPPYILND